MRSPPTPALAGLAVALTAAGVVFSLAVRHRDALPGVEGHPRENAAVVVLIEVPRAPHAAADEEIMQLNVKLCMTERGKHRECREWIPERPDSHPPPGWSGGHVDNLVSGRERYAAAIALRRQQPPAGRYELFLDVPSANQRLAYCYPGPRVRYWIRGEKQREIDCGFSWPKPTECAAECDARCRNPAHEVSDRCAVACDYVIYRTYDCADRPADPECARVPRRSCTFDLP